ncbi:MAG: asparagine synthase (glutamine-hydrolyzing) [Desulfobulbaceae bacterium]|nr:asparagine synthase (glutamine-hydrolyzing) [Desulfobulbaceae bacterium]
MCGIAGFLINNSNYAIAGELIEAMSSTLSHRGPDGWGTYLSPEMAIGHRRLSIVDLAAGMQPMMTDRYVIGYNGEIFNYIELRRELEQKGVSFRTHCDTEVVLKAFELYGSDAFAGFNGQFAIIIWDRLEKKVVVARDRYGVRPLYVLDFKGSYYFASEMKAFDVIQGFQRTTDITNLFQHGLLWNTVDDATVYKNIRSVPGGTYEIYHPGRQPRKYRYYEIGESPSPPPVSFEEAKEQFSDVLLDAVKLRLRSDVPVAAYLSGGIDSSVISYLVAKSTKKRFKTFSVGFEDREFDETSYQDEMVNYLGTEHYSQQITYESVESNLLDAVYHTERPIFRTAPVPLFLLSKKVHNNDIKVVLTGEGADEILFGYDSFKELKLLDFWSKNISSTCRPQLIKKLYPHLQHYSDPRQFGMMKMYYEGFLSEYDNELTGLNIRIHNNKILANLFNKDFSIAFDKEALRENIRAILPDNFSSWSILQQNHFLEMKSLLSGYLLSSQGDRMSMAHSVEGRYPFLDHRVVEQMFHLPDSYKLKVFSQKYLLTETFKDVIPASIIHRPKRPYMAPDLKSFFRDGKLTDQAAHFFSDEIIDRYGIFDKKYVGRFLNKFTNKTVENIGYRDNMIATFVLSAQMAAYWAENPRKTTLSKQLKEVEIIDN